MGVRFRLVNPRLTRQTPPSIGGEPRPVFNLLPRPPQGVASVEALGSEKVLEG